MKRIEDVDRARRVERVVATVAAAMLARQLSAADAAAALAAAMAGAVDETATPRELAKAGRQDHRACIVAEMARLEKEGRRRDAAGILAGENAADKRDPVEVETLKNKYQRWRRIEEKKALARLLGARRAKREP
jgi:hypothetical protein